MTSWSGAPGAAAQALWVEQTEQQDTGAMHLRHPGYAWLATVEAAKGLDAQVQTAAMAYLGALASQEPALAGVLAALRSGRDGFAWLPITWGLQPDVPQNANPNSSFLVTRGDAKAWREASLVLLAARQLQGQSMGDAVGIRVTVHVRRQVESSLWQLRFASVAASRLDQLEAGLPAGLAAALSALHAADIHRTIATALKVTQATVHAVLPNVHAPDECELQGLAVQVRRRVASDPPQASYSPRKRVFGYAMRLNLKTHALRTLSFQELGACMHGPGPAQADHPVSASSKVGEPYVLASELRLFERDPASMGTREGLETRRPSAASADLDAYREFRAAVPATTRMNELVPPAEPGALFIVTHERTATTGAQGAALAAGELRTALLPLPTGAGPHPQGLLPLRSDNLAAAQAYLRAKELFDRFAAYGFNVSTYFRHAHLPLELRPRARLPGAFDGRTVNAEVRPFFRDGTPPPGLLSPANAPGHAARQRPRLLVRLGSADTHVRSGQQALGLAADPRWVWHEFGHVLNFAATGELEFAFAHSAGDALAAIAADPDSLLAADEDLRGHTFPWAHVPRRHDRQAMAGYGWCGARSRLRLQATLPWRQHRHGYFEEELLASSLFRLYRCLGGDTGHLTQAAPSSPQQQTDLDGRRSASDYCVYLIMRAIALLGPNGVAPARSVGAFVGALIDADLGTGPWQIAARWPYRDGVLRKVQRQGGLAHKVIRWAFEQQGLYAAQTPGQVVEGPGRAPPVDVYIASQRPGPAGGYEPVPLRWHPRGAGGWYAHPQAIVRSARGQLTIQVSQRGLHAAGDLVMRLWACAAANEPFTWQPVEASKPAADGQFTATLPHAEAAPLWVLACAGAAADPSNLDAGAVPPTDPAALMELVASDNNLALAYLP